MTKSRQVADFGAGGITAGKNKIINGDFFVNQRGFSTTTTSGAYTFDRWANNCVDGTVTTSAQTFTLGTAPVVGYEAQNFIRQQTTSQTLATAVGLIYQAIESVRTFANQTVTISFWAKSASGTPKVAVETRQSFGTGGSPSTAVETLFGQVTLSTSWARYTVTATIPSIAGKTLGTNNNDFLQLILWTSAGSNFNTRTNSLGIQSNTFDIWGVQVEVGSVATPFTTATGTTQGELAACQRYYYQSDAQIWTNLQYQSNVAVSRGTTLFLPQFMRVAPTLTFFDSPGTSGKVSVSASSGGYSDNITPNVFGQNSNAYAYYVSGSYVLGYTSKITASAEL